MSEPNLTETAQEVAKLGGSAAGGAGIWLLLSKLLGHRESADILKALQELRAEVAAVNAKLAVFGATAVTRAELEPLRTEVALLSQAQAAQAKTLDQLQRRLSELSEGVVLR